MAKKPAKKRSAKAQARTRHKADFAHLGESAAALAHDLGNPIHSILNISQALAADSKLRDNPIYYDYLVRNAVRCQELMSVMQNILRGIR